jgi:poly(3-hydroxybutyrate) depolymerase
MHGSNMTADQENDNTNMRELGRQFGYVVLQPNAPQEVEPGLDAPVHSMMRLLIEAFQIDEKRIHMTGFSRGGYMAWRFVCDHAEILASAAPMCAAIGGNPEEPPGCPFSATAKPAVEISLMHLQGTKDPFISNIGAEAQRDAVVAAWQMGPGRQVAGDATYRRIRYENTNGIAFDFVQHDYSSDEPDVLGHCFPTGTSPVPTDPISAAFGCTKPNSFHWGSEVMQFFIAHPKH